MQKDGLGPWNFKFGDMAYYDPRADIIFRKIFGEHKNLCISLLNALLPLKEDERIETIEYLPSELFPEDGNGKNSIVDVRCTDKRGRTFIVEMQMYWTASFKTRALLNGAKAFSNQATRGMKFKDLKPVYCLCLLNENMPDTKDYPNEYSHQYLVRHAVHDGLVIEGIKFVFVELPKFQTANKVHKKLADLWLSFLTMMDDNRDGTIPEELYSNKEVSEAVDCLKGMSLTPEERYRYEKYWDNVSCEASLFSERYEWGYNEGKKETARNMKAEGIPVDTIAKCTGLSPEEIEGI